RSRPPRSRPPRVRRTIYAWTPPEKVEPLIDGRECQNVPVRFKERIPVRCGPVAAGESCGGAYSPVGVVGMVDVVVVGAGIAGLTSAVRLQQAGASVAVVTADEPEHTVSAVAAAVWYP